MRFHFTSLALATLVLLSACGGGSDTGPSTAPQAVQDFAGRMHAQAAPAAHRPQALATVTTTTTTTVSADQLFDWAEYKFAALFPKGGQDFELDHLGVHYQVRAYANGNFLGLTTDGQVFGLGPFTEGQLVGFGQAGEYAAEIQADRCSVYPGSCGNGPLGALNACTRPAAQALALGQRMQLTYVINHTGADPMTGEYTLDALVDANTTFEGQPVVRNTGSMVGSFTMAGMTSTSRINSKAYLQAGDGGLTRDLGDEAVTEITSPAGAMSTSTRTVNTPADLNSEFTLQPGQSLTKTTQSQTTATTTSGGVSLPPSNSSLTTRTTYTFEGRETLTVRGRSYDTCRYREVDADSPDEVRMNWYIVGKGVPAKSTVTATNRSETTELKSGSFNGSAL